MIFKNNLKLISYLRSFGIFDTSIISAIEAIPIELFNNEQKIENKLIKNNFNNQLYQKYFRSYLCAIIAKKLQLKSHEKILDIGSGTGYFTAVFSKLSRNVFSIEKIRSLHVLAINNFKKLKLTNIKSKCEHDINTWIEEAPFDKIFISGLVENNSNLIKQINRNGRLIMPILLSSNNQIFQLFKVDKNKSLTKIEDICEVNLDSLNKY